MGKKKKRRALYPIVRNLGFSLHETGGHGKVLRGNGMANLSFRENRLQGQGGNN